jgi:hypothetical protein
MHQEHDFSCADHAGKPQHSNLHRIEEMCRSSRTHNDKRARLRQPTFMLSGHCALRNDAPARLEVINPFPTIDYQ